MSRSVRTRVAAVCTLLAACASAGSRIGQPAAAERVEFRRTPEAEQFRTGSGVEDSLRLVVRDSLSWRTLWNRIQAKQSPKVPPPTIDFTSEMVVVVALGIRNSTGHAIQVDSILANESDSVLEVHITKKRPPSGTAVGMLVTAPLDVVQLPRRPGEVRFIEQQREWSDH